MKLSRNFDSNEFLQSNTATRLGFEEQSTPPDEVIDNLQTLCIELLQPLRDGLPNGFLRISSGYRCERLNKAVGGKSNSQHLTGCAADVQYIDGNGQMNNLKIIEWVQKFGLSFDQMLNEFGGKWIHLSYVNDKENRKQILNITT